MKPNISIRRATDADIQQMQKVELDAAQLFLTAPGHEFCAALPSRSADEHHHILRNGESLVACDESGNVCGFILLIEVDTRAHIFELSVSNDFQKQGIGKALVNRAALWAKEKRLNALTLTTYQKPLWNAPWYRKVGFTSYSPSEGDVGLRKIVDDEISGGFNQAPRLVMKMDAPK